MAEYLRPYRQLLWRYLDKPSSLLAKAKVNEKNKHNYDGDCHNLTSTARIGCSAEMDWWPVWSGQQSSYIEFKFNHLQDAEEEVANDR